MRNIQQLFTVLIGSVIVLMASSVLFAESINYNSDTWNFGIGTTQPQGRLHLKPKGVTGSATVIIEADSDNNNEYDHPLLELRQDGGQIAGKLGFWSGTDIFRLNTVHTATKLALGVNGTDAVWVTSPSGNVGIGTAEPLSTLHIWQPGGQDATIRLTPNGGSASGFMGRFQALTDLATDPHYTTDDNRNHFKFYTYFSNNALHKNGGDQNTYIIHAPWVDGQVMDMSHNGIRFLYFTAENNSPYNIELSNPMMLMMLTNTGRVGVGTQTPASRFHVVDPTPSAAPVVASFQNTSSGITSANTLSLLHIFGSHPSYGVKIGSVQTNTGSGHQNSAFVVYTASGSNNHTERFRITHDGKVGIGTAIPHPDFKLTVKGGILASKLKIIRLDQIPDYVFEPTYPLMPLDELETFITTHKHLPNIPSEKKIHLDGGIDIGEMNLKLLEKIEELTLYVIALHEKDKRMEKELSDLREQLQKATSSKGKL